MQKLTLSVLLLLLAVFNCSAATNLSALITIPSLGLTNSTSVITIGVPRKVSSYTNRPAPLNTDLILLADPANVTNANITWYDLKTNLLTSITSSNIIVASAAYGVSHTWPGPSNVFRFGTNDYFFAASTPCAITGFTFAASSLVEWSFLLISNAASTNITFTPPDGVNVPVEDTTPYTITNFESLEAYLEHKNGHTNLIVKPFRHTP